MSTALATVEQRYKAVGNMLTTYTERLAAVIPVGSGLSAARAQQVVLAALTRENNRYVLEKCTPQSIVRSCLSAAEVGLELGSVHGEAYLVPYSGKCTMMIGYRGFTKLVLNDPKIATIKAVLVREADVFEVDEGENRIIHKLAKGNLKERGEITHAYAMVRHADGIGLQFEVMDRIDLDRIKKAAIDNARGRQTPWKTHEDEMYKKCPIRRMAKVMNLSALARRAAEIDDEEHMRRGDVSSLMASDGKRFDSGRVAELTNIIQNKDAKPLGDVLEADFE